jgi:hypothetical protein
MLLATRHNTQPQEPSTPPNQPIDSNQPTLPQQPEPAVSPELRASEPSEPSKLSAPSKPPEQDTYNSQSPSEYFTQPQLYATHQYQPLYYVPYQTQYVPSPPSPPPPTAESGLPRRRRAFNQPHPPPSQFASPSQGYWPQWPPLYPPFESYVPASSTQSDLPYSPTPPNTSTDISTNTSSFPTSTNNFATINTSANPDANTNTSTNTPPHAVTPNTSNAPNNTPNTPNNTPTNTIDYASFTKTHQPFPQNRQYKYKKH